MSTSRDDEKQLDDLRALIFGDQGEHVNKALKPHARKMVSKVVSEAIVERQKTDKSINNIVMPLVEDSVEQSVTRHGEKLTNILYPLVGSLVRKSVSAFLNQFIEKTNEVIETALSVKGLSWRYQAWRSGIPFSQFIAAKTYHYRVEQALLIHRETGLLIKSVSLNPAADEDADHISSMLTAINDFVSDSFKSQPYEQRLGEVKTDDFVLLISHGPQAALVVAVSGTVTSEIKEMLQQKLETIHSIYAEELAKYEGDNKPLETSDPLLRECLVTQVKEDAVKKKRKPWFGYIFVALLILVICYFLYQSYLTYQLKSSLTRLNEEPGITLLEIQDGKNNQLDVTVLRDQASLNVSGWIEQNELNAARINIIEKAFISVEPEIALIKLRALVEATDDVTLTVGESISLHGNLEYQQLQAFDRKYTNIPGIDALDIDTENLNVLDISFQAADQPDIQRQLFEQLIGDIARIQIGFEVNEIDLDNVALQRIDELTNSLKDAFQ
ncbi:MAG: hypothetical protein AAGJ37_16880, partial [Pseudomonadota bacterium]